jgi:hypothetical protein
MSAYAILNNSGINSRLYGSMDFLKLWAKAQMERGYVYIIPRPEGRGNLFWDEQFFTLE